MTKRPTRKPKTGSPRKSLFAAKYVTYLPSVEELERELERDRRIAEAIVDTPRAAKPPSRAKRTAERSTRSRRGGTPSPPTRRERSRST